MSTHDKITNYFLYYKLEKGGKDLVSGNIWGTEPGRSFHFDLDTHKFFDFSKSYHSGRGFKKLFELRNEELPNEFRLNYSGTKETGCYKRKVGDDEPKLYTERLDIIPPELTPPSKISIWNNGQRHDIAAVAYTYKNGFGERVGYIMRGVDPSTSEKIIRPLSVWLRGEGKRMMPSYRQKKFIPFLYNYDLICAMTEKIIIVVEGEKCADFGMKQGALQYGLPIIFTTWPFGAHSYGTDPLIWAVLKDRKRVVLWPDNDNVGKSIMKAIQDRFLPQAKMIKPEKIGLKEKEDIADLPVGRDFETLLKNIVNAFHEV